jgi:hypothetical protein
MAHPSPMSGNLQGPFTHWYPDGAVESHGNYVQQGGASVPDGVWGFWYPDGKPKAVGRYDGGQPVGCFATWDEQGVRLTGVVDGEQLRVEHCDPPVDDSLARAEMRSHPRDRRELWGDVSINTSVESGTFGESNPTQRDSDPSPRAAFQAEVRKHVGKLRFGGALGYRLSNSDDAHAYAAGAVAAYGLPSPYRWLDAEVEAQLGLQYLDITARRPDIPGVGSASLWAPHGGVRFAASFTVSPALAITLGARLDGSLVRNVDEQVQYCAPFCSAPVMETWKIGGAAYGVDLGVRLMLH